LAQDFEVVAQDKFIYGRKVWVGNKWGGFQGAGWVPYYTARQSCSTKYSTARNPSVRPAGQAAANPGNGGA